VRRYLRGEAVSAKPDDLLQRIGRVVARHRTATAFVVLLVTIAGVGGTGGVWLLERAERAEQQALAFRRTELQATAALRVQNLDDSLRRFERELARLAGATATALVTQGPGEPPLPPEKFVAGDGAPQGLVPSPFYGKPVSFSRFATSVAPGADAATAEGQLGAIGLLRDAVVHTMMDALSPAARSASPERAFAALIDPGGPIVRVTVVTAQGVRAFLPGAADPDAPADPRDDALYKDAIAADGVVWGASSRAGGAAETLPCAMAVRGLGGEALGVIRFDVDPTKAVEGSLEAAGVDPSSTTLIVDRSGKVLSQRKGADLAPEPAVLAMAPVKDAIGRGESGVITTRRDGKDVVVTYQPLSSVDWYVVTVAPASDAKGSAASPAKRPDGVSVQAARRPAATAAPVAPSPAPATPPSPPPSASAAPSASASAEPSAPAAPSVRTRPRAPADPFAPWKAYEKGPHR
jgi:hypothetical protein